MATTQSAGAAAQKFQYQKERPPNFDEKVSTLLIHFSEKRSEQDVSIALDQSNYDVDAAFCLLEDDTQWTFRSVNKPKPSEPQVKEVAVKREKKPHSEDGYVPQRTYTKEKYPKPRYEKKDGEAPSDQEGAGNRYEKVQRRPRRYIDSAQENGVVEEGSQPEKPFTRPVRPKKEYSNDEEGAARTTERRTYPRRYEGSRTYNKFQTTKPPVYQTAETTRPEESILLTVQIRYRIDQNDAGDMPVTDNAVAPATTSDTSEATVEAFQGQAEVSGEEVNKQPAEENIVGPATHVEVPTIGSTNPTDKKEHGAQPVVNAKPSTKPSPKASKPGSSQYAGSKSGGKRMTESQPKVSWVIKQKTPSPAVEVEGNVASSEVEKQEDTTEPVSSEALTPATITSEPTKATSHKEKERTSFQFKFGSMNSEQEEISENATPADIPATTTATMDETKTPAETPELYQQVEAVAPAELIPAASSPIPTDEIPVVEDEEEEIYTIPASPAAPITTTEPEQLVPAKSEHVEIVQPSPAPEAPQPVPQNTSILTAGLLGSNANTISSLQASNGSQETVPQSNVSALASSSVVLSHPGHQSAPPMTSQIPAAQRNYGSGTQNTASFGQSRVANPSAAYQHYRGNMPNQGLNQVYYQSSDAQGEENSDISVQSPSSNPNQLYMNAHVGDYSNKPPMYGNYADATQGYMGTAAQPAAGGPANSKVANRTHGTRDKYAPGANPADVPGGMPHPGFPYFPIFFPPPYQYPYFAPYQGPPPPPYSGAKGVAGSNYKGGSFPPGPGAYPYPMPYPVAYDEEAHAYAPHFHPGMYMDPNQQAVHQAAQKGPGSNQGAPEINPRAKPQPPMSGHTADYGQGNPYGQPNRFAPSQPQGNVGQYGGYGHPGSGSGAWNH